ncbi:thiamine-triphosphatase [Aulostomus maculatus]
MCVEVERKFLCNADTLKRLEEIGAVCIGQRQFHDQYFDTPQFDLTLRDVWLRKRKGCWELKCPMQRVKETEETSGKQSKAAALCSRYKEITNLPDIRLKLKEVMKDVHEDMDRTLQEKKPSTAESRQKQRQTVPAQNELETQEDESWLSEMNLVCFAEFTTVRQSFAFEEEGVHVDLDQADFGYHVGEIEVLVPEGGDMQVALKKIERTALKLGLTGDQRVEGKMNVYLKKHNPDHLTKLLSMHVL